MSTPNTTDVARSGAFLTTGDHKQIGRWYVFVAFLYLLVGGVTGGLLGAERSATGLDILETSNFSQIFTLHAVSAVVLFLIPAWIGLATYLVPLQVGARNLGLPRAGVLGFWLFVVGGGLVEAAYLSGGGPGSTDLDANLLWVVGLGIALSGLVTGAIAVVATALAGRAPALRLAEAPGFTWGAVAGGLLWIVTIPISLASLVLAWIDLSEGGVLFGGEFFATSLTPLIALPSIYLVAVPALGVITDVLAGACGARPNHRVIGAGIAGFAVLGFGGWFHPVVTGAEVEADFLFQAQGLAILAPVLLLVAGWADIVRRADKVRLTAGFLFAVGAAGATVASAAIGAAASVDAFDLLGTTWLSAHTHEVAVGIGLLAFAAAVHHWAPKLWGATLNDAAGKGLFALLFIGGNLLVIPDLIAGVDGMPLGDPLYTDESLWETMSLISAIGGGVVVLGVLGLAASLLGAVATRRTGTDPDPWGTGTTFEWQAASPPAIDNFEKIPELVEQS